MRIRITSGGIFGVPSKENPTGELPIGHELTVANAPEGWAGRYIDLDADQPAGEDVDALKARIAELEAENAKLKKGDDMSTGPEAKHRGAGSYSIMEGDTEVREKLTKDQAESFNALNADGKAKWLADNPKLTA